MGSWSSRVILSQRVQKFFLLNTIRLITTEISIPVKHYESVYDLLTNIPRYWQPYKMEIFVSTFSENINKYEPREKSSK